MFDFLKKDNPKAKPKPKSGSLPAKKTNHPSPSAKAMTSVAAPSLQSLKKENIISLRDGKLPAPTIFGAAFMLVEVDGRYFEFITASFPADNQKIAYMQYRGEILSGGISTTRAITEATDIRATLEKHEGKAQDADAPIEEAKAIFRDIIAEASRRSASDVHFVVMKDSAIVLFRTWGEIVKYKQYEPKSLAGVLSAVYNKMHDPRSNSDASFSAIMPSYCTVSLHELSLRLRWQTVPRGYEDNFDVVCRLIAKNNSAPMTLDQLGYLPGQARLLEMVANTPSGGIFVAGVTGSGKSKTLQSLMWIVAKDGSKKCYTVEDPIEYPMFGVTQTMVQRNESTEGNPFAKSMKTFMRADPDTIMAGEIRDGDSAQVAEDIVRSGHQLLTTIHAKGAMGIVGRLASRDIGMSRETLSEPDFLSALVFQHLVPVLCKHCKRLFIDCDETRSDDELVENLFHETRYGLDPATVFVRGVPGCDKCTNGVSGVTVCAEVIAPGKDYEMLRAFRESRISDALQMYRAKRSSRFDEPDCQGKVAIEAGIYKVSQGLIDPRDLQNAFGAFSLQDIN